MSVTQPGSVRANALSLDEYLASARASLTRLAAHDLATTADAVVLDIRTPTDRSLYGCIPGSFHTPRTVLEWRVALDAPLRLSVIHHLSQRLVVVCNDGNASSLAAVTLQQLGYTRATDLIGGVLAWKAAALPLTPSGGDDEVGMRSER